MAGRYLGSTLHDTHQVACLVFSDDSNGVLVNRVEGDELGALIVVPQSVLVLIALCQHLSTWHHVLSNRPYQTTSSSRTNINTCGAACLPKPNKRGSLESAMLSTHCYLHTLLLAVNTCLNNVRQLYTGIPNSMLTTSMASSEFFWALSAAYFSTSSLENLPKGWTLSCSTVSLFRVKVPVLSEQRMSMPAVHA